MSLSKNTPHTVQAVRSFAESFVNAVSRDIKMCWNFGVPSATSISLNHDFFQMPASDKSNSSPWISCLPCSVPSNCKICVLKLPDRLRKFSYVEARDMITPSPSRRMRSRSRGIGLGVVVMIVLVCLPRRTPIWDRSQAACGFSMAASSSYHA